ncbi:NUDIX domain-containing protein [Paenibacillus sp. 481]|uniref:NUDIX domain-containing protein n=1 Tax=Paenibacillus sp. 481 TaxID=2835869 RepID=UPI001E3E7929|nr:NUDIX domain-containing protein [Paenibacillus sp. 481]UHA72754.1 NUDIX domain-containing protein [Paenibacillus sp. 481]
MEKYTHLGVYGVVIMDGSVLLTKKARGPHTGKWDFPGGRIEFGEEPFEALKREFLEETGLSGLIGRIRTVLSYTLTYPYPPSVEQSEEQNLEIMHHIGMIYNIKLEHGYDQLKIGGDDQDCLEASWMKLDQLEQLEQDAFTPFVCDILLSHKCCMKPH